MAWTPGDLYDGWDKIRHSVCEAMKHLPQETLRFMSFRATDAIIHQSASEVLDWLEHRDELPEFGWFVPPVRGLLRSLP
jgi:hypothetical protein